MDERTADPKARVRRPPAPNIGADGEPVYDQLFFLALARRGKDVWNRWRDESDPGIAVTFKGVDFREPANAVIDFSEFNFGNRANFAACKFGAGDSLSFGSDSFKRTRVPAVFERGMAKFTEAIFGERVSFSRATIGSGADFSGAKFGRWVDFSSAQFGNAINLSGAVFGPNITFSGAVFGVGATFCGAVFGHVANFNEVTFGPYANFSGATFGESTFFGRATFGFAEFSGTSFGDQLSFGGAVFHSSAIFEAMSSEHWSHRMSAMMALWPDQLKTDLLKSHAAVHRDGSGSTKFGISFFNRTQFKGVASFCNRSFDSPCNFTGAIFRQPPNFDGCDGIARIYIYGGKITFSGRWKERADTEGKSTRFAIPGWTTDSTIGLRLRTVRKLAEEAKAHDLEHDLFVEERKAERGILLAQYWNRGWASLLKPKLYGHCLWIVAMAGYSLLADYGRSFVRPLVALAVSVPLFWWSYSVILILPIDTIKLPDFRRATWAFAISNAVPFVGALTLERDVKLTLLCGDRPIDKEHAKPGEPVCVPIPGRRFQLLALGQSIFSALCIFFAGLALRNYFKLR